MRAPDLFMFLVRHAAYDEYVTDYRDIYEECRLRYGPASDYALKLSYVPLYHRTSNAPWYR
jgi:hypothetical protein